MAYNPNQFTPMGQLITTLGGGLGGVMQGYLNSKIEEGKRRREAETNKQIIMAQNPNLSPEQVNAYAQVPTGQLSGVLQGLRTQNLQQTLYGQPAQIPQGGVAPPVGQLPEVDLPQMDQQMQMTPGEMQMPQQEEAIQEQPEIQVAPGAMSAQEAGYAPNTQGYLNRIAQLKQAAAGGGYDLQGTKLIQDEINTLEDRVLKETSRQNKLLNGNRNFQHKVNQDRLRNEREDIKLNLQIQNAANKSEEIKYLRERRKQDDLKAEYGDYYAQQIDNYSMATEDMGALNALKNINNNPNIPIDSPAYLTLTEYGKKLGLPTDLMRGTPTQIMQKLFADLNYRTALGFKGTGIRAATIIAEAFKKNPSLFQSPEARGYVIEALMDLNNLKLKQANIAMALKKKNKNRFFPGFKEDIIGKLKKYDDKIVNGFERRMKKLKEDKGLQKKQELFERQQAGQLFGSGAGFLTGAIPGAVAGFSGGATMPGGIATKLIGGAAGGLGGGLIGLLGGGQVGGKIAEYLPTNIPDLEPGAKEFGNLFAQNPAPSREELRKVLGL